MRAVRRWGPWLVLVAAAVAVLVIGVQRGSGKPSLDAQVQHISSEVRCPVCDGETVAQSQAAPSVQIRNEIRADLQKGQSQGQILSSLVASYGSGILEKPQAKGISLLVWVLPVIGVVVAASGLLVLLRRWKRAEEHPARAPGEAGVPVDPSAEQEIEAVPAVVGASPAATGTVHALGGPPTSSAGPRPGSPAALVDAAGRPALNPDSAGAVPGRGAEHRSRRSRRAKAAVACAGVVLVAGGASWAVAASSGTRLPGDTITGQALGAPAEAAALQAAQTDENRNDVVDAAKEYQKVLASDPKQVEALSGEGWLLAETGEPSLLNQGLSLLAQAEQVQPDYAAAHLYRGLALLSEADYTDSVPELQWYLGHNPDPQLVSEVQKALSEAKAKAATQPSAASGSG